MKRSGISFVLVLACAALAFALLPPSYVGANNGPPSRWWPPFRTATPRPTATRTAVPTATRTPVPTATRTAVPTATRTPVPLPTSTPVPTNGQQVSSDTFAAPIPGQHQSEVEPDTFGYGGKVVSAFQVGRFYNGGSTDVGWATNANGTWSHGYLPGMTTNATPAGPYDRDTDPSVAYDASHGVWLIQTLPLNNVPGGAKGVAVVVSRSTDGLSWSNPVVVSNAGSEDYDKNWIACDNHPASPYYGHCYSEWDDVADGDLILMSTSTNGGLTWSTPASPSGGPSGLGGQPVVQPNGKVVVPAANGFEGGIISFSSTDGGATWGAAVNVSGVSSHNVAGGLRTSPLPSAEIDSAGRIYVVWQDCRFESSCHANDIVMSTSDDGVTWSAVTRIPIDAVNSGADHFIPGVGVDPSTSGSSAHLALTYYYYSTAACSSSTCDLRVGFVSSTNGGSTWTSPQQLAGPMSLGWLPVTNQGSMVGDYISTSITNGTAVPVFAVAQSPASTILHQSMYGSGLQVSRGSIKAGPTSPPTLAPLLPASQVSRQAARTAH